MGLDLYPIGRAKPGHEAEWETLVQTLYDAKEESEDAAKRRFEISMAPWAAIGAPCVGYDPEADAWALANWPREDGMSDAALLDDLRGYYVLELLRGKCEGLPKYTHSGMYDLDETSFRGAFLNFCEDLLGEELLITAWTDCMPPEEAMAYGKELLEIADKAARKRIVPVTKPPAQEKTKRKGADDMEELSLDEKIDILRTAGRWYIFWGKLGHPIVAWF